MKLGFEVGEGVTGFESWPSGRGRAGERERKHRWEGRAPRIQVVRWGACPGKFRVLGDVGLPSL